MITQDVLLVIGMIAVGTSLMGITGLGIGIWNNVAVVDLNRIQQHSGAEAEIERAVNLFSTLISQKNMSAYDGFTTDAIIDFSASGAPGPLIVGDWISFQQFIWELIVWTQTSMFPNVVIDINEEQTNATVTTGYMAIQTYYGPETIGSELFPSTISGSTAVLTFYAEPPTGIWKITSITIQPGVTLIQVNPVESGGQNTTSLKRSVRAITAKTDDSSDDEKRHYYTLLIASLTEKGQLRQVEFIKQTPEYVRLFP